VDVHYDTAHLIQKFVLVAMQNGPQTQRYNKYLTNLIFSVRTVSYGSLFFPLGFMAHTLCFVWNIFSLQKLADLSNKIQRIEIMMSILEAKVEIVCLSYLLLFKCKS